MIHGPTKCMHCDQPFDSAKDAFESNKKILELHKKVDELKTHQGLIDCCRAFIRQNAITEVRDVFDNSWVDKNAKSFIRGICDIVGWHKP